MKKLSRGTCRKLADIIKNEDILDMFKNAKNEIKDWTAVSRLNPAMSKGIVWNLFAARFDVSAIYCNAILAKMLYEFGEYLTLNPYMESCLPKPNEKIEIKCVHREPDFSNYK